MLTRTPARPPPQSPCAVSLIRRVSGFDAVYLMECGVPAGERSIRGAVDFVHSIGPLTEQQWAAGRALHCIDSAELPYGDKTFAWEFTNARWFDEPFPDRSHGGQVWAKHYA